MDVTTPAGCLGRDSAIITVYPGNFATPGTNWEVCPHDTVQFSVTGADHYAWHPTLYLSDSTIGNPYVAAITSQTYEVIAFSTNGCRDTVTMRINVWPGAVVYLEDSVRLYPGEQVHLQPYTNCTSLTWFPPQGLSDWQVTDPIATPDVDTRFYVYGTTDHGCKVVDSIDIFVNPDALIQVPNAFAPGAEANGTFKIISLGTATLNHFRIYNRWGNLVFETKDIAKGWDGMYNG
ncbi:MAG: hypothetical protein EBZ77_16810, partial [Chitinophagia bacterium]|nr:hypothetical protein [Chitinophagia bacterium]